MRTADPRSEVITVRCTLADKQRLHELARQDDVNLADVIRKLVREAPLRSERRGHAA